MKNRRQLIALFILLAVLGYLAYNQFGSAPVFQTSTFEGPLKPIAVEDTRLSLEKLKEISLLEYKGSGRSIFSAAPPPPPQPTAAQLAAQQAALQQSMTPPPPPPPPFRFYGYVTEQLTGRRRAFFTNGDDVFITAEGGTIQNRWRLLRINPTSADFEELSSGRRASIPLEEVTTG